MWQELMWTERSEEHMTRHGVRPAEVEQVVHTRPQWEKSAAEGITLLYGLTDAGRPLLVALSESVDGRWYVITASNLSDTELRTFRRQGQRPYDLRDEVRAPGDLLRPGRHLR